ncbi:MAG: hypothetical protein MK085_07205 [Phycisphaerales bacterium]|nr:hypothetical protein [Phycisphaerales bacterium]
MTYGRGLVAVASAACVGSAVSAGTITSMTFIGLEGVAGGTHQHDTPTFPAQHQLESLTISEGVLQTWVAGSWHGSQVDAWYATSSAPNNHSNSAQVSFEGQFQTGGNYNVHFTPHLAGGFHASGLSVLISSGTSQLTLTSSHVTGSIEFLSNAFTVTYTFSGEHDSPFTTTSPRVGGSISFEHLMGEEDPPNPVPGVGVGAFLGIGVLARRRRNR